MAFHPLKTARTGAFWALTEASPWMTEPGLSGLYGIPSEAIGERIAHLLDMFGLSGCSTDRVGTYSRGIKQRLKCAPRVWPPALLTSKLAGTRGEPFLYALTI